jgi:hypothetical protein
MDSDKPLSMEISQSADGMAPMEEAAKRKLPYYFQSPAVQDDAVLAWTHMDAESPDGSWDWNQDEWKSFDEWHQYEWTAENDAVKLADDGPWIWRGPITGRPAVSKQTMATYSRFSGAGSSGDMWQGEGDKWWSEGDKWWSEGDKWWSEGGKWWNKDDTSRSEGDKWSEGDTWLGIRVRCAPTSLCPKKATNEKNQDLSSEVQLLKMRLRRERQDAVALKMRLRREQLDAPPQGLPLPFPEPLPNSMPLADQTPDKGRDEAQPLKEPLVDQTPDIEGSTAESWDSLDWNGME